MHDSFPCISVTLTLQHKIFVQTLLKTDVYFTKIWLDLNQMNIFDKLLFKLYFEKFSKKTTCTKSYFYIYST